MARLICEDETEITISKETEESLREQFGKPEKFKKISFCHLQVSVPSNKAPHAVLNWYASPVDCLCDPYYLRRIIEGLQSAIDYIENEKDC